MDKPALGVAKNMHAGLFAYTDTALPVTSEGILGWFEYFKKTHDTIYLRNIIYVTFVMLTTHLQMQFTGAYYRRSLFY